MSFRRGALDLLDRCFDVPEGQGHHRQQAIQVGARPVDEEVVVGADALEHQLGLAEAQEAARAEAAEVRIEHHRVDLLFVHEREPRLRVVRGGRDVVVAHRNVRVRARVAGHRVEAGPARRLVADEPHVAAFDLADVRHLVAPLAGHTVGPDVCGLGDVRVDVDDLVLLEQFRTHLGLLLRRCKVAWRRGEEARDRICGSGSDPASARSLFLFYARILRPHRPILRRPLPESIPPIGAEPVSAPPTLRDFERHGAPRVGGPRLPTGEPQAARSDPAPTRPRSPPGPWPPSQSTDRSQPTAIRRDSPRSARPRCGCAGPPSGRSHGCPRPARAGRTSRGG